MRLHLRLFYAAMALLLPGPALACDYLTQHFEHCFETTPFAEGVWDQGGDSATLYLDKIGFEGFEDYIGHGKSTSLRGALDLLLREMSDNKTSKNHLRDRFSTSSLKIVRSIDTEQWKNDPPQIRVMMIAQAADRSRISLSVTAPADTPIAELDHLSRAYAALVRPRPKGN
jgi:hypothetical protein